MGAAVHGCTRRATRDGTTGDGSGPGGCWSSARYRPVQQRADPGQCVRDRGITRRSVLILIPDYLWARHLIEQSALESDVVFAAGRDPVLVGAESAESDRSRTLLGAAMDIPAGIRNHLDAASNNFLLLRLAVPRRDEGNRDELSRADLCHSVRRDRAA